MKNFFLLLGFLGVMGVAKAQSFDYSLLKSWNIDRSRGSDPTYQFFSDKNNIFIVGLPAGVAIAGFLKHDDDLKKAALNAGISLGVSSVITWGLKYGINRERPFVKYPDVVKLSSGGSPSFPSGHASSAFAVATSISISYPKWYVIAPCYLWASGVAVSRVALGVHYPTDVLAGAVVGAGSAFLTDKANKWLHRRKSGGHPVSLVW
jgi:membrane-associated phospholipid phosphatase